MSRRLAIAIVPLLAFGLAVDARAQRSSREVARLVRLSRAWPVMGTMLVVTAWVTDSARALPALVAARDSVRLVDSLMSTYRDSSDVSRVNVAAGAAAPVHVAPQTMTVLEKARLYWRLSDGAFDPTVGPLVRAWQIAGAHGRRPDSRVLDSLRRLVGFGDVELDASASTARLSRAGMRLDLGGIAKGFALDLARRALQGGEIHGGTIDLGGNVLFFGRPPHGGRWHVQIVDPLDRDRVVGDVTLDSGAVATSGQYENYVVVRGTRYGHLIDPRTGEPARGVLSATAIGPMGEWSDGLSATLFLVGPRRGSTLADSLPGVSAVWIVDRGQSRTALRDLVCSNRIAMRFAPERRLFAARVRAATTQRSASCRSASPDSASLARRHDG